MIQIRFPLISKKVCQESHRVSLAGCSAKTRNTNDSNERSRSERPKRGKTQKPREHSQRGEEATAEGSAWRGAVGAGRGGGGDSRANVYLMFKELGRNATQP